MQTKPLVEIEHAELLRYLASRFADLVKHQRLAEKVAERIEALDRETQEALDELQRRIDVLREQRAFIEKPWSSGPGLTERVMEALPGRLADVAKRSGDDKSSVNKVLRRLFHKGVVTRTGEPGSYWYELATSEDATEREAA
jgi:transcription initiation factor IIE alpha subunit